MLAPELVARLRIRGHAVDSLRFRVGVLEGKYFRGLLAICRRLRGTSVRLCDCVVSSLSFDAQRCVAVFVTLVFEEELPAEPGGDEETEEAGGD